MPSDRFASENDRRITGIQESAFVIRRFCPACGSTRRQEVYSASLTEPPLSTYLENFYAAQGEIETSYLRGVDYILDECMKCGLVYQRAIPNEVLMKKLYEEWIDQERVFNLKVKTRKIEYYTRLAEEIAMIVRHFGTLPGELELFDFGMGWGDWCRMAQAYGCSAIGTELSRPRIDHAKKSGIKVISRDEIQNYRFDFINTEQVFEHIANPLETLKYLCGSLKPRGIIKISVPNGWNIKEKLMTGDWNAPKGSSNSLNPVAPLEHINCFSNFSLVTMARLSGLMSVQMRVMDKAKQKRIIDHTLRDVLGFIYQWKTSLNVKEKAGSTYLFFQKETD